MKFEYFVGKEFGKHGGERFEVNAGWQLRNRFRHTDIFDVSRTTDIIFISLTSNPEIFSLKCKVSKHTTK